MKAANRNQFFKTTLDFKTVSSPNSLDETWLIPANSDVKTEMLHEWQIPVRDAAYNAFMEKLAADEVPLFRIEELDPQNQFPKACVQYAQDLLDELARNYLAQAIIDDEREIVKAILDKKPELLLNRNFVIPTSEYTGQRFSSDNFLGLACRRKQIEMVKIITPYFDRLVSELDSDKDELEIARIETIKNEGLAQWVKYQMNADDVIQIPETYQAIVDDLIKVFQSETVAKGNIAMGPPYYLTLNTKLETAIETLYTRLLLDFKKENISERRVFTKQNYLDIELLIYASYKTFVTNYDSFRTREQSGAFCVRVIGLLQNFLPPEAAKIVCAGVYGVMEDINRNFPVEVDGLKLKDNETLFYSIPGSGLGYEYNVNWEGWQSFGDLGLYRDQIFQGWESYVKHKQQLFENYLIPGIAQTQSSRLRT